MELSNRFVHAFVLASKLHSSQKRKGTEIPYIAHLMSVAALTIENGADEDVAIAALLHDAAEDQGGEATLKLIEDEFGSRVRDLVDGCSDTLTIPKPPWQARKQAYIEHLRSASCDLRLISACDKLHNARSIVEDLRRPEIGRKVFRRFTASAEQTIWYYEELTNIFLQQGPKSIGKELATLSAEMRRAMSK